MIMLISLALSQDKVFSGPQKGEKTPGFRVLDMTGEHKGKEVDYVAEFKGAPTLFVFIHELTRPAAQLFRRLDDHAAMCKGLRSMIVMLPEDLNKTERYVPLLQSILKLKSIVAVSMDGKEGPGSYGLNRDVTLTIVLAKDNAVVGNWALREPNETDAPAIIKLMDALAPPDLQARVEALEKEVRELRALVDKLQPKRPSAPKDEKLNGLMRRLIRPERTDEEVDAAMKEIEQYIEGNDALKKEAREGFALLAELKYGTEYAKKKIAEAAQKMK